MRNLNLWVGGLLVPIALAGCDVGGETANSEVAVNRDSLGSVPSEDLSTRWFGQTQFESLMETWGFGPMRSAMESAASKDAGGTRSVEEADLFRHDSARGLLFVLNTYRGLQVVDVSNPDAAKLIGRADLGGIPVEMFQKGNNAYVILNAFQQQSERTPGSNYQGAQLAVYDLSNPVQPIETARFEISGYVTGSRLLATDNGSSTVIYVTSNVYDYTIVDGNWQSFEKNFVMSIDVTDPTAPREVETIEFVGSGHNSHVTTDAIYVSSYSWDTDLSSLQYVDISDLHGDIALRGKIEFQGNLAWGDAGDLQMDEYQDVLRVASSYRVQNGDTWEQGVRITTLDVANPDTITTLDTFDFGAGHRVVSARFAKDAAYVFHMVNVDPLEVLDLSNPSDVKSAGLLEIDGWVTHIEVRGDKLVTLGVNSADNRQLALILFDVSNPANPLELDRAAVGEGWTWSQANHDLKAFTLVDDLGLALLPVSSSFYSEETGYRYSQWVQLFSFDLEAGDVQARGKIENIAAVRAFAAANRIMAFSEEALKVVDATNADAPKLTAEVELARDVADYVKLSAQHGALLVSKNAYGNNPTTEIRIVPAGNPDGQTVLATLTIEGQAGQVIKLDGNTLAVAGNDTKGGIFVRIIDVKKRLQPKLAGELKAAEIQAYLGRWGSELLHVGNALAFVEHKYEEATGSTTQLRVVSVKNAKAPELLAPIALQQGNFAGVMAAGTKLYVTTYVDVAVPVDPNAPVEPVVEPTTPVEPSVEPAVASDIMWRRPPGQRVTKKVAYSLQIVDLANPAKPVVSAPISVPGVFRGRNKFGYGKAGFEVIYTSDRPSFGDAPLAEGATVDPANGTDAFDALVLAGGEATLVDLYRLPVGAGEVLVEGTRAAFVTTPVRSWGPIFFATADGGSSEQPVAAKVKVTALDISGFGFIDAGDTLELAGDYGQLTAVKQAYAFVTAGWNTLHVFDILNPHNVTETTTTVIPGWYSGGIYVPGDGKAYLPVGMFGLKTVELQ